jgi:hypothetical protein
MQSVTVASLVPASLDPALLPVLAPDAPLRAPEPLLAPDIGTLPLAPDIGPLPLAPDFAPLAPDVAALDPVPPVDPLPVVLPPLDPEAAPELSPLGAVIEPALDAQPTAVRPARIKPNRRDDLLQFTPLI